MKLYLKDFFTRLPLPYLKDECKSKDDKGVDTDFIENLSKINVFIGSNDSGKSYLLRELAKADHAPTYHLKSTIDNINGIIKKSKDILQSIIYKLDEIEKDTSGSNENLYIGRESKDFNLPCNLDDDYRFNIFPDQIKDKTETFDSRFFEIKELHRIIEQSISSLFLFRGNRKVYSTQNNSGDHTTLLIPKEIATEMKSELYDLLSELSVFLYSPEVEADKKKQFPKIYLYPFRMLMENLVDIRPFDSQIFKYHFNDFNGNYIAETGIFKFKQGYEYIEYLQLITGCRIPDVLYRKRTSTYEDIQMIEDFEKFLSDKFFTNQNVRIITKKHSSTNTDILEPIYLKIGDAKDLPVYNLGTGLQMMILLTLPLFIHESGIIYIEEPELFIHPGMQKQLMEIYANHPKAKNFQFFIATHSNHIIDSTILNDDISIYTIKKIVADKKTQFEIRNRSHGDQDALQLLGVSNSSVYLVNCTIWVEGVTDKLYISAYIKAFLNHLKDNPSDPEFSEFKKCLHYREGTHYGFVYSGGDNIIHWDFDPSITNKQLKDEPSVKYLCGEAFVVIDDDNEKNPSRKAKLKELLPDGQLEIIIPEIENLLSLDVILKALIKYKTWKNFDIDNIPSRTELESKLKSQKLGSFIDNNLKILKSVPSNAKAFSKDSDSSNSTINDKVGFCRKTIECITYSNMTVESKELVKKILTFVIQKNQGII